MCLSFKVGQYKMRLDLCINGMQRHLSSILGSYNHPTLIVKCEQRFCLWYLKLVNQEEQYNCLFIKVL
jgi:hypothetical protein